MTLKKFRPNCTPASLTPSPMLPERTKSSLTCVYAKTPYRLEQHGQERTALGPERSNRLTILTNKTIALS